MKKIIWFSIIILICSGAMSGYCLRPLPSDERERVVATRIVNSARLCADEDIDRACEAYKKGFIQIDQWLGFLARQELYGSPAARIYRAQIAHDNQSIAAMAGMEFNVLRHYVARFPGNKGYIYHQTKVGVVWRVIEQSGGSLFTGTWFSGTLFDQGKLGGHLIKNHYDRQTPIFNLVFDVHRLNKLGVPFQGGDPWVCAHGPVPFAALTDESKKQVLHAIAELWPGIYPMPSKKKLATVFGFDSVEELEAFLGDDVGVLTQANRALREELNRLILWDTDGAYRKNVTATADLVGGGLGHYRAVGEERRLSLKGKLYMDAFNFEASGLINQMPSLPGIRLRPLVRLAILFYEIGRFRAGDDREKAPELTAEIVRRDMTRLQFTDVEINFVVALISGGLIETAIRAGKYPDGLAISRMQRMASTAGLNANRQILESI